MKQTIIRLLTGICAALLLSGCSAPVDTPEPQPEPQPAKPEAAPAPKPVAPAPKPAEPTPKPAEPAVTKPAEPVKNVADELVKTWKDPKTGQEWVFTASLMNARKKGVSAEAAKIPFRAVCRSYKLKEINGRKTQVLDKQGKATFYITDAQGNIVVEERAETLHNLCPS